MREMKRGKEREMRRADLPLIASTTSRAAWPWATLRRPATPPLPREREAVEREGPEGGREAPEKYRERERL